MNISACRLNCVILAGSVAVLCTPVCVAEGSAEATGIFVAAQQTATTTDIEEIVVTEKKRFWKDVSESSTKMSLPLAETPQAITIIDAEFLESIEAQNYFDAVRYVSGVNFDGTARLVRPYVSSRGFTLDDHRGHKLNGNNLIQRSVPDMVTIERVELVKGANAIAFGQNPPGGFMNIITKRPTSTAQGYASVLVGEYNRLREEIDYGGPINSSGSVKLRGVGAFEESEIFQRFQSNHGFAGGLFLDVDASRNDQFSFNAIFHDKSGTPHFGLPLFPDETVPPVSKDFAPMQPWSKVDYTFLNLQGIYEHEFENELSMVFAVSHQDTDVDSRSGTPFAIDPVPIMDEIDPVTGAIVRRRGDTNVLATSIIEETTSDTAELRFGGDFELGGREHSFLVTAEYMRQFFPRREDEDLLFNPDGTPFQFNLFDPVYDSIEKIWVRTDETGFDQKSKSASAQIILRPMERVQVTAGYRYDKINEDLLVTGTTVPGWEESQTTPRVALMYGITDSINVYYSYSESFSPNGALDCNNNLLPPKKGVQDEIGLKGEFRDRALLLTVAAYQIEETNLLGPDSCGGAGIQRSRIQGKAKHKGFEAELVGLITPNWNVIVSASVVDANLVEAPSPEQVNAGVSNVPKNKYSVFSNYDLTSGTLKGFSFGLGVSHESSKQVSVPGINDLPPYTQWDAQIAYSGFEPLRFVLSAINFTDEVGYDALFGSTAIGNTRRPPRQISLRLIHAF